MTLDNDWTPTGRETVRELQAHLREAGMTVGRKADVPAEAQAAMRPEGRDPAPGDVFGLGASMNVKAMTDAFHKLQADGLGALAAKVATYPVLLQSGLAPNAIAATLGNGAAQLGMSQWFTVNVSASPKIAPEAWPGEPWSIRDARADMRAGKLTPREATQSALDGAALHEFGHALDNLTGGALLDVFTNKVVRAAGGRLQAAPWAREHISPYGGSQPAEGVAEAFSLAAYGKPLPPALRDWGREALTLARTGEAWLP